MANSFSNSVNIEKLLDAAKSEQPRVQLDDYRDVILELRRKGFSLRAIADWLTERHVPCNYTQVWRSLKQMV